MKNQKSNNNISFDDLLNAIEQLSEADKIKVLAILNKSDVSVVSEPNAIYNKPEKIVADFDSKWATAKTADDFKDKVHQHIEDLPWK